MTYEELKAEAERQGYGLHKSMKGVCTCITGREWQLSHGRKKCLRYEWWRDTKNLTYCKRIETERSEASLCDGCDEPRENCSWCKRMERSEE